MSMWLSIARVGKAAFDRIQGEPALLDVIFFDDGDDAKAALSELGIEPEHASGVDYRSAHEALVAMAEATGEELDDDADPVFDDLGVSGELGYDAGFGPAFYITPDSVANAKSSIVCQLDEDAKEVIHGAAASGDYLIGVIA